MAFIFVRVFLFCCSLILCSAYYNISVIDQALDCGVRTLALEFANYLLPQAGFSELVFDALRYGLYLIPITCEIMYFFGFIHLCLKIS